MAIGLKQRADESGYLESHGILIGSRKEWGIRQESLASTRAKLQKD